MGKLLIQNIFLSSIEPELFSLSNWGLEYFHPPYSESNGRSLTARKVVRKLFIRFYVMEHLNDIEFTSVNESYVQVIKQGV